MTSPFADPLANPLAQRPLHSRTDVQRAVLHLYEPLLAHQSVLGARVRLGSYQAAFAPRVAELEGFAGCGDFEKGFLRTACRQCGDELRVPFSCKGRGFCPSCMGRRMAEGAALLVDHVLPKVGYRQWVLSFAGPLAGPVVWVTLTAS